MSEFKGFAVDPAAMMETSGWHMIFSRPLTPDQWAELHVVMEHYDGFQESMIHYTFGAAEKSGNTVIRPIVKGRGNFSPIRIQGIIRSLPGCKDIEFEMRWSEALRKHYDHYPLATFFCSMEARVVRDFCADYLIDPLDCVLVNDRACHGRHPGLKDQFVFVTGHGASPAQWDATAPLRMRYPERTMNFRYAS